MIDVVSKKTCRMLAALLTLGLMGCTINDKKLDLRYVAQVESATFFGPNNAWLITREGDLLKTHDGGSVWETILGKAIGGFNSVAFIDDHNGWANTKDGQILRATDGGKTWVSIMKLGDSVGQMRFVDEKHGWIVHPLFFRRTEDGGITWQQYSSPADPPKAVFHCYFIDPQVGWLSGSSGAFYRTQDGGKTWQEGTVVLGDKDLSEVSFVDYLAGWLAARPNDGIYRTEDGGKTWRLLRNPGNVFDLDSVHFVNKAEGWAVGADRSSKEVLMHKPVVLHTNDGGESWERIKVGEDEPFFHRVYFADTNHGWILSRDNVYRTSDGGKTWQIALKLPSIVNSASKK